MVVVYLRKTFHGNSKQEKSLISWERGSIHTPDELGSGCLCWALETHRLTQLEGTGLSREILFMGLRL